MCIDRKLSLTTVCTMVRLHMFQHRMHYPSALSSCCKTLAVPGIRFVDRKLSLTTIVRLYAFRNSIVYYHSGLSSCYETQVVLLVVIVIKYVYSDCSTSVELLC